MPLVQVRQAQDGAHQHQEPVLGVPHTYPVLSQMETTRDARQRRYMSAALARNKTRADQQQPAAASSSPGFDGAKQQAEDGHHA